MSNTYTVEGNRYLAATKHVCKICNAAADGRMMWLKQRIPNGDVIIECPFCETSVSIAKGELKIDPSNGEK